LWTRDAAQKQGERSEGLTGFYQLQVLYKIE
jgi:hypothetical protein